VVRLPPLGVHHRQAPIRPADEEDWGTEPRTDAGKVRLRDVLRPRRTTIDYLYDFGDCWEHRLTVTNVRAGNPDLSYPRYIAGERNAPPEDCGGIPGFYETLDAVADPNHPNHLSQTRQNHNAEITHLNFGSASEQDSHDPSTYGRISGGELPHVGGTCRVGHGSLRPSGRSCRPRSAATEQPAPDPLWRGH